MDSLIQMGRVFQEITRLKKRFRLKKPCERRICTAEIGINASMSRVLAKNTRLKTSKPLKQAVFWATGRPPKKKPNGDYYIAFEDR